MTRNQLLIQRAVRIVNAPGWGGGLHREHLARLMGFRDSWDRDFKVALIVAYRRGLVSFCGQWVVAPAPPGAGMVAGEIPAQAAVLPE